MLCLHKISDKVKLTYKVSFLYCLFSFSIFNVLLAQSDTLFYGIADSLVWDNDLFSNEFPLVCTLKFDIKKYQKDKDKGKYHSAVLYYALDNGFIIEKKVRIKARGEFRRGNCTLPPFWLNIRRVRKSHDQEKIHEKLKLVTTCHTSSIYTEYLLREYLVFAVTCATLTFFSLCFAE